MKINLTIFISNPSGKVFENEIKSLNRISKIIKGGKRSNSESKNGIYYSIEQGELANQFQKTVLNELSSLGEENGTIQVTLDPYSNAKKVWSIVVSTTNELSQMNYLNKLGAIATFMIVPNKETRDEKWLPVSDHFYLGVPAYKSEKLKSGAVKLQLIENLDSYDELYKATKDAAQYFVNFLKQKGLFGKLDINNWRTVNRDLLEEKGFYLPEWE